LLFFYTNDNHLGSNTTRNKQIFMTKTLKKQAFSTSKNPLKNIGISVTYFFV